MAASTVFLADRLRFWGNMASTPWNHRTAQAPWAAPELQRRFQVNACYSGAASWQCEQHDCFGCEDDGETIQALGEQRDRRDACATVHRPRPTRGGGRRFALLNGLPDKGRLLPGVGWASPTRNQRGAMPTLPNSSTSPRA